MPHNIKDMLPNVKEKYRQKLMKNKYKPQSIMKCVRYYFYIIKHHLTTICVNVRDRVCLFVRYLLPNRLRYWNMNGTMLSQIVRGMF